MLVSISIGNSPDDRRCLDTLGGGLTQGRLPNQSYLPKFPSSKQSFVGMILLSLHQKKKISESRLGRKLSVKCNDGGGTGGKCALISVTRAISVELWLDETHPLGCNTIPRPQPSSLQDAEVNDEFIARPFKRLSQRTLPRSDLPFPPVSFPLFFRSDGRFSGAVSGPRWNNATTSSTVTPPSYSSFNFDRSVLWSSW